MIRTIKKQHDRPCAFDGQHLNLSIESEAPFSLVLKMSLGHHVSKEKLTAINRQHAIESMQQLANGLGITYHYDFDRPAKFNEPDPAYERRFIG